MDYFDFIMWLYSWILGTSGGSDDQQQNVQPLSTSTSSFVVSTPVAITPNASKKKKGHRRLGSAAKNDEGKWITYCINNFFLEMYISDFLYYQVS